MAKKNPKIAIEPLLKKSKEVKISFNPDSYRDLHISWQFQLMDFDFEFGWNNIISRINFSKELKENLCYELIELDCNSDLLKYFEDLKHSHYIDYNDFFKSLNYVVSDSELKCIISKVKQNYFWDEVYPKLINLEKLFWKELETETTGKNGKSKHHSIHTNKLINLAQERLKELRLNDIEELFSIRLTGTERLWGIRQYNQFKILWYDFDHKICPSILKHT